MTRSITPWPQAKAPGIRAVPPATLRALKNACRAVDRDIEQSGAVTAETVDRVRDALALVRRK